MIGLCGVEREREGIIYFGTEGRCRHLEIPSIRILYFSRTNHPDIGCDYEPDLKRKIKVIKKVILQSGACLKNLAGDFGFAMENGGEFGGLGSIGEGY